MGITLDMTPCLPLLATEHVIPVTMMRSIAFMLAFFTMMECNTEVVPSYDFSKYFTQEEQDKLDRLKSLFEGHIQEHQDCIASSLENCYTAN